MTTSIRISSTERPRGSYNVDTGNVVIKMHSDLQQSHDVTKLRSYASESFLTSTHAEKQEMQALNSRLAIYIDMIASLEDRNRRLIAEVSDLRIKSGSGVSSYSTSYSSLSEAKKIDIAAREKVEVAVKIARLTEYLRIYGLRLDDIKKARVLVVQYEQALASTQSEIHKIKSTYESMSHEEITLKADNRRLWKELKHTLAELDEEKLSRIDLENQVKTRTDACSFLRRVQAIEIKAYGTISKAPADTRLFYQRELETAIASIKYEYAQITQQHRADLEAYYKLQAKEGEWTAERISRESTFEIEQMTRMRENMHSMREKLSIVETSNRALQAEVDQLIAMMNEDHEMYEQALNDLNMTWRGYREDRKMELMTLMEVLLDTKQSLDAEIVTYRMLLEELEKRFVVIPSATETEGEATIRNWFNKSVKIDDISSDGAWIRFENTADHEEDISDNILRRQIDNGPEIVYKFPPHTIIQSGHRLTLWASGHKGVHSPPESLVNAAIRNWGDGRTVVTTLEERDGKVRARNTRTMEQHSVEQRSSTTMAISSGGGMLMNGSGLHREASYSSMNYSRDGSHHDISGGHHSSSSAFEANSGGYGSLRRSDGQTLYQQKIVSTGGDEIDLLHGSGHHGFSSANHSLSAATGRQASYVRESSSSSTKMSGGGSMRYSADDGSAHIASVTSRIGKYEASTGANAGGHHKVHHKFQSKQRIWDSNGESAI